jgi:hypothetical protein
MGYRNSSKPTAEYYLALANRPRPANASSKYRGVSRYAGKNGWRAALGYRGRRYYLGIFETQEEAAAAYNRAALRIIGSHAVLNQISND